MAEIFPKELPPHILRDPRRSAEIRVFNACRDYLPNTWTVFYSGPWWAIDDRGAEIDGECDFIIANESKGVLYLEVKGGRVTFDPETAQWRTVDRFNIPRRIKDPVEQVMRSKHHITKKLQNNKLLWPSGHVNIRHGVIFPDSQRPTSGRVGPYESDLFAFSNNFAGNAFASWVEKRLGDAADSQQPLGPNGIVALKLLYANPVELSLSLASEVERFESDSLMLLTGAQLQTIIQLPEHPRSVVRGGAGTGKTLLAQEYALRAAKAGKQVLVLCNNRTLYSFMSSKLSHSKNIDILAFEDLFGTGDNSDSTSKKWDVLILDEAQDVDYFWWDRILPLLYAEGSLVALLDSNQSIYQADWDIVSELEAKEFVLRLNLRNSKEIAEATKSLYEGPAIESVGSEEGDPTVIPCRASEQVEVTAKLVQKLIDDRGLYSSQVAVLFENRTNIDALVELLKDMNIESRSSVMNPGSAVIVDTVANFKGMEAPFVIIVATAALECDKKLCYIAISRARMNLFIVGANEGSLLLKAVSNSE
jgi:hypothetical protein